MNHSLETLRTAVDDLDTRIVALIAERARITDRIGAIKAAQGLPASDPARRSHRAAVLARAAQEHGLDEQLALAVYDVISRELVEKHRRMGARPSPGTAA